LLAAVLIATTLPLTVGSVTLAQGDERVVSGAVVQIGADQATISSNTGPVVVALGPDTSYEKEGPGTIYDIQTGQLVGITGRPTPEGQYAVQVRIFPAALRLSPTVRPMGGSNLGNLMTNAVVQSFADDMLRVEVAGTNYNIRTSPDTEVVLPLPATKADVTENARVAVTGSMGDGEVLLARLVNVLGPPPEMLP
jgi:hypothetical protein